MALRVLIVPDKFKGTLTALAAAAAIAAGWRKVRPGDGLELLPMSDGGDGFGEVLGATLGAKRKFVQTVDAAHRPLRAPWWHDVAGGTAIIDSAGIIGLAMLPRGKFHPFQLDSFGLGKALQSAAAAGVKRAVVGIGGSATNDGGFGLARALGWRFFNKNWDELTEWWQLHDLASIRRPQSPLRPLSLNLTVAVDVDNPLLGPQGASRIYGPQKGLRPGDFAVAEKCLTRLATVLKAEHKLGDAKKPGAGAAGGLGFGLMTFLGAKKESGFEIFAQLAELDKHIQAADIVVTGEGCVDAQTYMGKGVGQVAKRCKKFGVPCVALAGVVKEPHRARQLFAHARGLTELVSIEKAQAAAPRHLQALAAEVAEVCDLRKKY